jgi:hypothetical protein
MYYTYSWGEFAKLEIVEVGDKIEVYREVEGLLEIFTKEEWAGVVSEAYEKEGKKVVNW